MSSHDDQVSEYKMLLFCVCVVSRRFEKKRLKHESPRKKEKQRDLEDLMKLEFVKENKRIERKTFSLIMEFGNFFLCDLEISLAI